jgi:hypothetical protein
VVFGDPFDFSEIVGYPNDIPEDVIDNVPDFDHGHACAHIKAFTKFIDDWCDTPIHEDVLMRMFVLDPFGGTRKCL